MKTNNLLDEKLNETMSVWQISEPKYTASDLISQIKIKEYKKRSGFQFYKWKVIISASVLLVIGGLVYFNVNNKPIDHSDLVFNGSASDIVCYTILMDN